MSGHYSASDPGPVPRPGGGREAPLAAESRAVDAHLRETFERFGEWGAEMDDEELDPTTERLLDSLSGADDAPVEWRSLHRRVHERRLTWRDFWADPTAEAGGGRLFSAVLRAQLAESSAELTEATQRLEAAFAKKQPPR